MTEYAVVECKVNRNFLSRNRVLHKVFCFGKLLPVETLCIMQ